MCYFLNSDYTCDPWPRAARAHNHNLRTSVLCSNTTPCPLPLWETRSTLWPTPCPNCTGETHPFLPPSESWNLQDQETHEEAAVRYVMNLVPLINATILHNTPCDTDANFLSAFEAITLESGCREHPGPGECKCPAKGDRAWEYNLATYLRHKIARGMFSEFQEHVIVDEQPNEFRDPVLDPWRPVSPNALFSHVESARREEFASLARDSAIATMDAALAPLAHNVAAPARASVDLRAQVFHAFSLIPTFDGGLSPIRADMVLQELAGFIFDPTILPSASPFEFDTTRQLLGTFLAHLYQSGPSHENPYTSLHSSLSKIVARARETHSLELKYSLACSLAFDEATDPTNDPTTIACPAPCKLQDGLPDADPQTHHTPRVKIGGCMHVMGRRCAFRRGSQRMKKNVLLGWSCPLCPENAGDVIPKHPYGRRKLELPSTDGRQGDFTVSSKGKAGFVKRTLMKKDTGERRFALPRDEDKTRKLIFLKLMTEHEFTRTKWAWPAGNARKFMTRDGFEKTKSGWPHRGGHITTGESFGETTFAWPADAAMSGDMENAIISDRGRCL